jgi:hypothetical protein
MWRFYTRVTESFGNGGRTSNVLNPKTGSVICMWWWEVDHEKLKSWYKEEKIRRLKK